MRTERELRKGSEHFQIHPMRYFCDWNAGNPLHPLVLQGMMPWFEGRHGNPSSLHAEGREARRAVEEARRELGEWLLVDSREVVFVSGATEANHLAVTTFKSGPIAVSAIEHPCMKAAAQRRGEVVVLPVDATGVVEVDALESALARGVGGVAVMMANNETGVVQPVDDIGRLCLKAGVPFHVDAAQWPLRAPWRWPEGATSVSLSAHKMMGPKGVGVLVVRPVVRVVPFLLGGSQERDRRAGTENVPAIVGMGLAARKAAEDGATRASHLRTLEDRFFHQLREAGVGFHLHGGEARRLPGCFSIRFGGLTGEGLVMALDLLGVAIGLGSACSSGAARPSPVLAAMGVGKQENIESVRFSFGPTQTLADMDAVARRVAEVTRRVSHT